VAHVKYDELYPGGMRLEEIRFELGYLERKDFVQIFPLHLSTYCRILRYDRLSIRCLVNIFSRLIEIGYYNHFEDVLSDLDLFDDAGIYFPLQKTLQKKGIISTLQKVYDRSRKSHKR
jgi:hypothetical protein